MKNAKFVFKLTLALLLCFWPAFHFQTFAQQTHTVTGTVTDETGEPLMGASVFIKGTKIGTALQVRYIGYKETEVSVNGRAMVPTQIRTYPSGTWDIRRWKIGAETQRDIKRLRIQQYITINPDNGREIKIILTQ